MVYVYTISIKVYLIKSYEYTFKTFILYFKVIIRSSGHLGKAWVGKSLCSDVCN